MIHVMEWKNRANLVRGCNKGGFCGQFFLFSYINLFYFDVTICDLVHNVDTTYGLCLLLIAIANLF